MDITLLRLFLNRWLQTAHTSDYAAQYDQQSTPFFPSPSTSNPPCLSQCWSNMRPSSLVPHAQQQQYSITFLVSKKNARLKSYLPKCRKKSSAARNKKTFRSRSALPTPPHIALPQRRNMIRKVFLECFGAAMAQRADNFSAALSEGGPGERAEVTAHQLRRYFGLCGTPSTAKVPCTPWISCNVLSPLTSKAPNGFSACRAGYGVPHVQERLYRVSPIRLCSPLNVVHTSTTTHTQGTLYVILVCCQCCPHPSAQARLPSLITPTPEDEHRRASANDRRRLASSLSFLSAGADRVCLLYRVPPAETRAGGGPATKLLEDLRSLPEKADNEEQRQRARRAARGDTFEVRFGARAGYLVMPFSW